jgi:hypothetical protein
MLANNLAPTRLFPRHLAVRIIIRMALLMLALTIPPTLLRLTGHGWGAVGAFLLVEVWAVFALAVVFLMPGDSRIEDAGE